MSDRIRMTHPETGGVFYARPASVQVHEVAGWVQSPDEPDEPRRIVDEEPPAAPVAEPAPAPEPAPAEPAAVEPAPVPADGEPAVDPEPEPAARVAEKKTRN